MNLFGHRRAKQAYKQPTNSVFGIQGFSGPSTLNYELLGGPDAYFQSPIVYACVNRISNQLAALPRSVRDAKNNDRTPIWVEEPNAFMGGNDLIRALAASLLLSGEAFVVPFRGGPMNKVIDLAVVNPQYVWHHVTGNGVRWTINGTPFEGEMVHMKYNSLPGRIRATSGLDVLRPLTKTSAAAQEYVFQAVEKGGAYQLAYTFPPETTLEFIKSVAAMLVAQHSGRGNAYKPLLIGGGAKVDVINQSNADSGFLDLSRMTDREIAQYGFNMDESMFGLPSESSMTYRNEPGIWYRFWQLALSPIASEICAGLSLLTPRGHQFCLDKHQLILGGPHDRANIVAQMANTNASMKMIVFEPNEMREIVGLPEKETFEKMAQPAPPPMGANIEDSDAEESDGEEDDDDSEEEDDE